MLPRQYKGQKAFIFAAPSGRQKLFSLSRIKEALEPILKNFFEKIDGAEKCESAILSLSTGDYALRVISVNGSQCYSSGMAFNNYEHLNDFKIVLESDFSSDKTRLKLYYIPSNKSIHIRRHDVIDENGIFEKIIKNILNPIPIYISYGNQVNERPEENTRLVINTLNNSLGKIFPYVTLEYDEKSLSLGCDVAKFMGEIVSSIRVILLINKKYLTSIYCMRELMGIHSQFIDNPDVEKYIFPIIFNSASCVYKESDMTWVKEYWHSEYLKLKAKQDDSSGVISEINEIQCIIEFLPKIPGFIGNMYHHPLSTQLNSRFIDLIWEINKNLCSQGYVNFYPDEKDIKTALSCL